MNTGSAIGRFFLTMAAGFAEMERNLTGERTKAALQHKKINGEKYSATPYGYQAKNGCLVKDPQEQAVVVRINALRETGTSYQRIADALNADNIPTKRGDTWYGSTVRNIALNGLHEEVK